MGKQTWLVSYHCFTYLLLLVVGIRAGSTVLKTTVYVSHSTGTDIPTCGSQESPCKTLKYSSVLLVNGGFIYLNGTDSLKHPYTCGATNMLGVRVNLTISSWHAHAYVACEIIFRRINPEQGAAAFPRHLFTSYAETDLHFWVTLMKVSFIQGGIRCYGICAVNVSDSTFSSCTTALLLNGILPSSLAYLNVTKTTFYKNLVAIDVSNAVPSLISIVNSNFSRNNQSAIKINNALSDIAMQVQIYDCIFEGNSNCMDIVSDTSKNKLHLNGGVLSGHSGAVLVKARWIKMAVDNVTLQSNKGIAFHFSAENGTLNINNSVFAKNYVEDNDSLFLVSRKGNHNRLTDPPEMTEEEQNTGPGDMVVNFQNTLFSKNKVHGLIIRLCHSSTKLINVTFKDNAFGRQGDDIYITNNNTVSRVTLKNVSFILGGVHCSGVCSVDVSDSNFSNCTTALLLNGSLPSSSSYLNVTRTIFHSNKAAIDVSNAVPTIVSIAHSNFRRNGPQLVIKINNIQNDKNIRIQIHDCSFQDNIKGRIFPFLPIFPTLNAPYLIAIISDSRTVGGIVAFHRNNFAGNAGRGVQVDGCFVSTFENVSMTAMKSNALMVSNRINCSTRVIFQIKNSLINGTVSLYSKPIAVLVLTNQITMSVDNVTLQSNKGTAFYFSAKQGALSINRSVFAKNYARDDDNLVLISRGNDNCALPYPFWFTEENAYTSGVVVNFQNTLFLENKGLRSIMRLCHSSTKLFNVTFKNNSVEGRGGDIFISNNNSVSIYNSLFNRSLLHFYVSAFVYSELNSNSSLNISNSSFESNSKFEEITIFDLRGGLRVSIDNASNITCPSNRFLESTANLTQYVIHVNPGRPIEENYKAICKKCHFGYSLQRVYVILDTVVNMDQCLPCPYGGNCSHGIVARPNFWGHLVPSKHPPTVAFNICPLEYCGPNPATKPSYHSCCGNRSGVLCGQCSEDYTEDMFSTECREKKDCNDHWFWFFSVAYVICISFLLITRPCVFGILWKNIVWFRHRNGGNSRRSSEEQRSNTKHFDHAVLKTMFYFYQIVELLLIATSPEDLINDVKCIRPLVSVFNFQIRSWNEKFGCPFPGLSAVTKRLFSSLTVFGTIVCITTICVIHKAMSYPGCLNGPHTNLYLAAIVHTLLLGYERLTEVSLSLLNCVPVDSEWRLFLDGNIRCWQWWQYALLSYIVVFVVPFIFVLYWGSRKLNQENISTKELTMACIMPLPLLCYWAVRYCFQNGIPQRCQDDTEEIKLVLQEPFRPLGVDDEGTLYWESVLIGRRLLLLCLHSFIADPMLRLLCLNCACMAIFIHHLYKKPYKDTIANACESFSLSALVIIATFSLAEASLVSQGIEMSGPGEKVFGVLQWIELALLGVAPACLCVLVSLAVVSQLVRLLFHVIMFIKRQLSRLNWRWNAPFRLRRPLLSSGNIQ